MTNKIIKVITCSIPLRFLVHGANCKEEGKELIAVQIVHRHGARSPVSILDTRQNEESIWSQVLQKSGFNRANISTFHSNIQKVLNHIKLNDTDNQSDARVWDHRYKGWWLGKLTWLGEIQTENLGKKLRKRYVDDLRFLPERIEQATNVHYSTTNFSRTIFSAENVVKGLYPDADSKLVVDTWSVSRPFGIGSPCALRSHLTKKVREELKTTSDVWFAPIKSRIEFCFGLEPTRWLKHGEAISCYHAHNIPFLPDYEDLNKGVQSSFSEYCLWRHKRVDTSSELMIKLLAHPLVEHISEALRRDDMPFCVFSAHDTTLIPILYSIECRNSWPNFASYIVFEVWREKSSGWKSVRCYYNGEEVSLFGEMELGLDEFINTWQRRYMCTDRDLECQIPVPTMKKAF